MAVIALQQRVRANQWKSVLMIANLLQRNLPTFHRVTALAVGAKLAAMNVGMAVGAILAHVLENQACMALGAGHLLVHAPQRIPGVIVIELRVRADRLPARIGVTLLARDSERAVRIGDFRLWTADAGPRISRRLLQACA